MLVPANVAVATPQSYLDRQGDIAAQATGIGHTPCHIDYLPDEHLTWAAVQSMLEPLWQRYVAPQLCEAKAELGLPADLIPQLGEVSDRLQSMTGFRYAAVSGTVSADDFFAALAQRIFPSTQFIRWSGDPMYTRQPDVIHEVAGHAVSLAHPQLAELHHLAGQAAVAAPDKLSSIATVFWYSIEFGVVASKNGWKAYGTGLLSSSGELGWFSGHADVRPLNIEHMLATPYDISRYQPVLFGATSLDEVSDIVGGYFTALIASAGKSTDSSTFHPEPTE